MANHAPFNEHEQDAYYVEILFRAMRNLDGVEEGPKIARLFTNGTYTDEAVAQRCWEILWAVKATQKEGPLAPSVPHSKFERYASFEERFDEIVTVLRQSKSICKQIMAPSIIHRVVDQPQTELKQKSSNREINARKTQQNKIGQQALALGIVNENGELPGAKSLLRTGKRRKTTHESEDEYEQPLTRSVAHGAEGRGSLKGTHTGRSQRHRQPALLGHVQAGFAPDQMQHLDGVTTDATGPNLHPSFDFNFGSNDEFRGNGFDETGLLPQGVDSDPLHQVVDPRFYQNDLDHGIFSDGMEYVQIPHGIDPRLLDMGFPDVPLYYEQSPTKDSFMFAPGDQPGE